MALSALHTLGSHESYLTVRDFLIKAIENPGLFEGTELSGLVPHGDTRGGLAVGYGFDLIANPTATVLSQLEVVGHTLPDSLVNVLTGAHETYTSLRSTLTCTMREASSFAGHGVEYCCGKA